MTDYDRLPSDVLSALRSLISGFPSLDRARDTTRRFAGIPASAQADPVTRARLGLLRAVERVLDAYAELGVAPRTMLHDIPLLVHSIKAADQRIRNGEGFQGFN